MLNCFLFIELQTELVFHLVFVDIQSHTQRWVDRACTFCTVLSGSRAISGTPASSIRENRFKMRLADLDVKQVKQLLNTHDNSPPQCEESTKAMFSELLVLNTASTSHGFNHFLVEFHGRGKHLGVTTKDIAKVHMDQVS